MMIELERLHGCLLGGALGDALGYPLEFLKPASIIAERFGTVPPRDIPGAKDNGAPAPVSDDTQMTLFTAEAILRARGAEPRDRGGKMPTVPGTDGTMPHRTALRAA